MTAALAAPLPLPEPDRPHGRPHGFGDPCVVDVGPRAPALLVRGEMVADLDALLVRRAQAGDREAFGELYRRHRDHIRRYLVSRQPDREADADDLVAETFLTAMQRISAFQLERPGEFGNWLVGIARNKLLGWLTRTVNRETALDQHRSAAAESGAVVSPEEIALDRLEAAAALARLSPRERRALMLQHVEDLSSAEIALALGTTKRSLWALTGRARSELRGQVRRCACGCGTAIRPERWGRDRYASTSCRRQAAIVAAPLCACGCGAELPAARAHNRLYATRSCRNRAAWRRRQDVQRRYLAGPVSADPAVERVLAVVREAGGRGMTRAELSWRTRLLAARLDRALDRLTGEWLISGVLEPSDGRLVVRYRALAGATARRAA